MKTSFLILSLIVAAGLGSLWWWNTVKPTPLPQSSTAPATQDSTNTQSSTATSTDQITAAQVAQHNTASNCWMVISGKVYNVTDYIPSHPGGSIIATGCGKDATKLYNSRPGSNTPHPSKATAILQQMYIGKLAG